MKTVYKYLIEVGDSTISLPKGAELLTCQVQNDRPVIWAKIDLDITTYEKHLVRVVGTGHAHEDLDDFTYLATFQLYGGAFVGHVFTKVLP